MELSLRKYLENCRELTELTTQNGWIDNNTLKIEIIKEQANKVIVNVKFQELVMEGAGCIADRIECYGKVALQLDQNQQVIAMQIL